ncbi:hypothetical protein [Roseovarius sp. M141]|uniref:hypothetical protein n=1 Tax=Roseovarius sp. M141 TaxID=2583806 RepID=UPI0020CCAE34|nr:hypothetical protein [Roseovarius sp. M141]MCQ0090536.1 hypothetical protein [Roseovarius sp. M141]
MTEDMELFVQKFRTQELSFAEPQGWQLSLRPAQTTLGAMILSVQSGARDLTALDAQEAQGMSQGFALAEHLARSHFGAVRINILCLMMQDPIVHFHILPRYDQTVGRYDKQWTDADWPRPPHISTDAADEVILMRMLEDVRTYMKQR